jgi:plasmid stability protein
MASLTIRRLTEETKRRLRIRAAENGRSMEEEAREILNAVLSTGTAASADLAASIRARVAPLGGVELEIPPRDTPRDPPGLG